MEFLLIAVLVSVVYAVGKLFDIYLIRRSKVPVKDLGWRIVHIKAPLYSQPGKFSEWYEVQKYSVCHKTWDSREEFRDFKEAQDYVDARVAGELFIKNNPKTEQVVYSKTE